MQVPKCERATVIHGKHRVLCIAYNLFIGWYVYVPDCTQEPIAKLQVELQIL